jgi:hypothetical protein
VLLEQPKGWLEVGGLEEAAARGGSVGIAAAELGAIGPGDPVQDPAGVVGAGVGAHQVEHRAGVLDEVVGQSDSAGEGVGPDGLGPAVAEMFGQVEEGGEAAGGPGEFGRPAGQVGQVAAVDSEPRLQVTLEVEQQVASLGVEGEYGGVVAARGGQAGGQGLEFQAVAVSYRRWDGAPAWRRPTRLAGRL